MTVAAKIGPIDVGQFLIGAVVVIAIVVLWCFFLRWALAQVFGELRHEHRWGRWRPYSSLSYRSRCWCGAQMFTRTSQIYEKRPS